MKHKRLPAFCTAALCILSSISMLTAFAESEPCIQLSNTTAEAGKEAVVTVNMKNNPGISGWQVLIHYDSNAMTLKDASGDVFNGTSFGDFTKVPLSATWFDTQTKDEIVNGKMLTLTFDLKETAKAGVYEISLDYEDDWISDKNDQNVHFDVVNGSITVTEPIVAVSGVSVEPKSHDFEKAEETITLVPTISPANATNKKVSYSSSNTKVATVDANGKVTAVAEGTADITVKTEDGGYTAKCSVTVAHEHSMQTVDAKISTCIEHGNNKYYYCTSCKKYFKDEEGKTPTTVNAEKLALADHKYTKQDTAAKFLKSAANCKDKAVYYYSCEICGAKGSEAFEYGDVDKTNHIGETEIRDKKDPMCEEAGYTGDTYCKTCGERIEAGKSIDPKGHTASEEWSTNEDNHWKVCTVCEKEIDKAAHNGGEATCKNKAVCKDCGKEYGELNPVNHKGKTEIRGYIAPTETEEGYSGDTYCLDCGEKIGVGKALSPHVHKLVKTEAKEATHFAAGNIEYYTCEEDGMIFKDADAKEPITIEATVIPQIEHAFGKEWKNDKDNHWHECECGEKSDVGAHAFGEWQTVTEATTEAEGSKERFCTVCGFKETESVEKLKTTSPGNNNNNDNPKTGAVASAIAAISVLALGAVVALKKKR